ncbi:MAG TPA: hypothetical protein VK524_24530 [Polyangiaceae bacterium]|nr:hypothetical protein [Polyangiaceae bacterium]
MNTHYAAALCKLMLGATLFAVPSCEPRSPKLPVPSAPCPAFVDDTVTFSAGGAAYPVRLHLSTSAAAGSDGPLVLFFAFTLTHTEAAVSLGEAGIERIENAGGVVAEILQTPQTVLPRTVVAALADEIVACADARVGIDPRRIHAAGESVTAEQAARLAMDRSSYIASLAVHRGGASYEPPQTNDRFAALITLRFAPFSPDIDGPFASKATSLFNGLKQNGHYALFCDSDGMLPGTVQFFVDHPFGTSPSPYAAALPPEFAGLNCPAEIGP